MGPVPAGRAPVFDDCFGIQLGFSSDCLLVRGISAILVRGWRTGCVVPGHSFLRNTIVLGVEGGGGGVV